MDGDWFGVILIVGVASVFGVAFLGYVRAGMNEAESDWRRRMRFKYCVRCGYSLRGNTSGVCPECGKRFKD